MEQKVIRQCIHEGEMVSALIDKITVDNEFVEELFSSENLENTLANYEFSVSNTTLSIIKECIEQLDQQANNKTLSKNEILADKLINSLAIKAVIESGNSAAGNWD